MTTVEQAEKLVLAEVKDFGTEPISFEQASGRALAEDIKADRDLPPLALKALDSHGGVDARAVIRELIRSPVQFAGLCALAVDSRAAFRALKRCRSLLPGLFLGLGAADL